MLSAPVIQDQASSLRRLTNYPRPDAGEMKPRVMTITSGKGGVGKSTLALNLAVKLGEMGQSILLIDADSNLGSLDVMLGVSPKWRLRNVLEYDIDLEDALVNPSPRLKMLAGNSGEADYPLMGVDRQNRFLQELVQTEERYDVVLIDTAAGLSKEIVNYGMHSDEVLVVTNPEPTSVMDAYAVMKMIRTSAPGTPMSIVMNAVRSSQHAQEAAEKLQMAVNHFLNMSVDLRGEIPFDEAVPLSILQQQPVVRCAPYSAAALSIQSLAQTLCVASVSKRSAARMVSQ